MPEELKILIGILALTSPLWLMLIGLALAERADGKTRWIIVDGRVRRRTTIEREMDRQMEWQRREARRWNNILTAIAWADALLWLHDKNSDLRRAQEQMRAEMRGIGMAAIPRG